MSLLSRHKLLPLGVLALLAAIAFAIAMNGGGQDRAGATATETVEQQFQVFSQGAETPDTLPEKAQQWLASIQSNQSARLAEESSQSVAADNSEVSALAAVEGSEGSSVLVAALGGETICTLNETPEIGVCASKQLAEAGHAFSATPVGCDAYSVIGIMPDGVSSLSINSSGGGSDGAIPVESNVYEATLSAEDTVLTSEDPAIQVELPLGEYANMNPACQ